MSGHAHRAQIRWARGDAAFTDNRYSRAHSWHFDGGIEVPASSSPHVVRVPLSEEAAVDPEEAFVASIASCHMLWFLSIAAAGGFRVDEYADAADGVMGKNAAGKTAVTRVTLRPHATFSGEQRPSHAQLTQMHHKAHEECFIANSVTSDIRCEPLYDT
ncbi:MAG: OsmC family protein [Gammaproteobacteria bacterium]|nr:OsmC family protein [Gammaproteobacteria bacterium]